MAFAIGALAAVTACNSEPTTPTDNALSPAFNHSGTGNTVVVTESDITRQPEDTPPADNWVLYFRGAGNGTFRQGPPTPPEGTGSLELVTPSPADKVTLFNFDYHNTPLDDFTALGYHTFRTTGTADQLPSLNVTIDYNGPAVAGGFATLVFEPVYNPAQGPVTSGVWQDWDAILGGNAIWWSTRPFGTVCAVACYVTWNQILAAAPQATILGGIGINQGSGGAALTAATDAFLVGVNSNNTTFDFELFAAASSKDDCKNGGWQTFKRANGSSFKNQGDCVSYTNNGK